MNLDKANRVLELLRQITNDMVQENNANLSDEHLELQAHLVLSIEREACNLKKELIKAQITSNIPNKKIAIFFDMTPARISQLKAEILEEKKKETIRMILIEKARRRIFGKEEGKYLKDANIFAPTSIYDWKK